METKGNGANNYDIKKDVPRFPSLKGPQFAAGIVAWVIAIAIIVGIPYGAYRAGKYLINKGRSDLKTEIVYALASDQGGQVDDFIITKIRTGETMITFQYKPFPAKK